MGERRETACDRQGYGARLLGVDGTVVEDVDFDESGALVVWVRRGESAQGRPLRALAQPGGPQRARLAEIAATNEPLFRAYLLKEQLRQALKLPLAEALELLDAWLAWALRSRLPAFVKLAQQVAAHLPGIAAALRYRLSNARTESVNTRIRLISRRAFGFHSPEALIALALLSLGDLCPPLPGLRRRGSSAAATPRPLQRTTRPTETSQDPEKMWSLRGHDYS
ncbi:MAG: transposase [Solirubrobacteraceae bacterium]